MARQGEILSGIGVVAIGRNEGERLRNCLESVVASAAHVIYVDSGSTDGSVEMAHAMGVDVVTLDLATPFTAARARNEGFRRLRECVPELRYVQFVDGDCMVAAEWLPRARVYLDANSDVAAVCGRRRERYPEKSVYNLLCDMEWDTPVGSVRACGGDALMRIAAFEAVAGFRADLIAGEEPELCVRLRHAGWRIWRLDAEMTLHDAAIYRFGQWWKRTLRAGYAFALGADLHGDPPERFRVREWYSAWFWGLGIPAGAIGISLWHGAWAFILLLVYPLQIIRLALRGKRTARENWLHAAFMVMGKFPEMLGQLRFLRRRWLGVQSRLIEYK